jgi:hypothetical protein
VSHDKKPLFHYVKLALDALKSDDGDRVVVRLTGMGMACARVVTLAELLKRDGACVVTRTRTGSVKGAREGDPDRDSTKSAIEMDVTRGGAFEAKAGDVFRRRKVEASSSELPS